MEIYATGKFRSQFERRKSVVVHVFRTFRLWLSSFIISDLTEKKSMAEAAYLIPTRMQRRTEKHQVGTALSFYLKSSS